MNVHYCSIAESRLLLFVCFVGDSIVRFNLYCVFHCFTLFMCKIGCNKLISLILRVVTVVKFHEIILAWNISRNNEIFHVMFHEI